MPHVGCWSGAAPAPQPGPGEALGSEPKSSPWGWICPSELRSMLGALIYCDLWEESGSEHSLCTAMTLPGCCPPPAPSPRRQRENISGAVTPEPPQGRRACGCCLGSRDGKHIQLSGSQKGWKSSLRSPSPTVPPLSPSATCL